MILFDGIMIEHYNLSAYMKVLLQSENQSSDASCPVQSRIIYHIVQDIM